MGLVRACVARAPWRNAPGRSLPDASCGRSYKELTLKSLHVTRCRCRLHSTIHMTTHRMSHHKSLISFGIIAFSAIGCTAPLLAPRNASADLRGSAAVSSLEPKLIVVGPARLLHVATDRKTGVTFFSVPRRAGTVADCRVPNAETAELQWDRESDLLVRKDESICVATKRKVHVSWHAQPDTTDRANAIEHASLR